MNERNKECSINMQLYIVTEEIITVSYVSGQFFQDILPSDGPDSTRGSSLFGTRSPLPSSTAGGAKATKPSAPSPRKTGANESDSDMTETESEWEKERALKKAQKDEELEKVIVETFSCKGKIPFVRVDCEQFCNTRDLRKKYDCLESIVFVLIILL